MMYQIKDLRPDSKQVNILVKLVAQADPRYAKGHKILTFTGADPTGQIYIPFWNNDITAVKVGDFIEIRNGYVSVFQDKMQLNVGKFGSFHPVDSPEEFEASTTPPQAKRLDTEITDIDQLDPNERGVMLRVFVKEKVEERTVHTKLDGEEHRVASYLVGDATGCILLTLWDTWIDKVKVGITVVIRGGYLRAFKGQQTLNLAKGGMITRSKLDIPFNQTNNLSEKVQAS